MKRKSIKIGLIAVMLLASKLLISQEVTKMDLQGAIDYAFANNISIKNAILNLSDAEKQIVERRAVGIPQVTGNVRYQRYLEIPQQPLPDAFLEFIKALNPNEEVEENVSFFLRNNLNAAINLDAMVFDGSYFVALKAAKAYRKYVRQDLQVQSRTVKNDVINAFLPILLADASLEIIEKNIVNLEKLLFETNESYKAGFVEQLDIDRQELSLSNLRTERDNLLVQKQNALTALKFALGYPIEEDLDIAGDLKAMTTAIPEEDLTAAVNYKLRPEVELINQGIHLNELNLDLNRAGYLPTLRADASYTYIYQGDNFSDGFWSPLAFVGLTLNIPIFDGFDKQAKIQRTRIDIQESLNQKVDILRGIDLEVTTARKNYLNAQQKLENQEKNLALAERIYNTTQIKYKEGVGSSLEVTQAEQSLYASQSNHLQALYDLVKAKMDLEIALGK